MNPNRRMGTTESNVNPYGLGRNRRTYYSFSEEEDDEALHPSSNNGTGSNTNTYTYTYVPLGGDYSNETTQAAWLDRNGAVPLIELGDKRYYLNKRNWNWLMREAASRENREMLSAGIRDTDGLHNYIRSKYPNLLYMLGTVQ